MPPQLISRSAAPRLVSATWLVLTAFFSGCGPLPHAAEAPRSVAPSSIAASLGRERCAPFQWVVMPKVSERYLMRIPVEVAGKRRWYQLDTGAFRNQIYLDSADIVKRGWALEREGDKAFTRASLSLGTVPLLPDARLEIHGRTRGRLVHSIASLLGLPVLDGTLGLEAIKGRMLLIDYPEQRLCLLEPDQLPPPLERRIEWITADMRNNHFFVDLAINDEAIGRVFFDTGASLFPLSVDHGTWTLLTGRTGEEPENRRLTVNSWGEPVTYVGAPATGALRIGSIRLERPIVYYSPAQPEYYARWSYPVTGFIGNAPFFDRVIVLDARQASPRFGIVHEDESSMRLPSR